MTEACHLLDGYLDNALSSSELRAFEDHLENCSHCRQGIRFERALATAARAGAQRMMLPPEIVSGLKARLARRRIGLVTAVAAALAGIVLIPFYSYLTHPANQATRTPQANSVTSSGPEPPGERTESARLELAAESETVAKVKGDSRHVLISVPTQSRQVTFVMVYPTISPPADGDRTIRSPQELRNE